MSYYEIITDGRIGRFTTSEKVAEIEGLTLHDEREIVFGYDGRAYFADEAPAKPVTVADYDAAMEAHLKAEQVARGYTTRSPNEYANSTNARWKQDAADWSAHVTAVMEYALEIENKHAAGETVPTLDEFKAALPKITWTITDSAEE